MSKTPPAEIDVEGALATLKDFQRTTAEYAFRRLYLDADSTHRFLVADEVGLGKTLVARAVIARAIQHLRAEDDHRNDVVYICSNAAIARQNVRKLDVTGAGQDLDVVDRITMLPVKQTSLRRRGINLIAISPRTSLQLGRQAGKFPERALLFTLLCQIWGWDDMKGSGPARLFYAPVGEARGRERLYEKQKDYDGKLKRSVRARFRQELQRRSRARRADGEPSLKREFRRLAREYQYARDWAPEIRARRSRFIGELREALATVSITLLQPDLVILDEFQRFKELLDQTDTSWANRLAQQLFDFTDPRSGRPTRTLLLSATPYRMYTQTDDGEGGDHHEDLVDTAGFLFNDANEKERLRADLRRLRSGLLELGADGGTAARAACAAVGARLRRVMVRTERLASTPDRNGMLATPDAAGLTLLPQDLRAYLATARIAEEIGQADVVEYWKSSPYLLCFMEGYVLKREIEQRSEDGRSLRALEAAIDSGEGLLPWDAVERYRVIDPQNARLRALIDDTIGAGAWQLLWLPPALPYYTTGSEFESEAARRFTKRLVFSAWHVVPKVIATLVSYEAERRMVALDTGGEDAPLYSAEASARAPRYLDFRMDGDRPAAMTHFAFVYPSAALATLGDPRAAAAELARAGTAPTRAAVLAYVRDRIEPQLGRLVARRARRGAPDPRWYWAAPLYLDWQQDPESLQAWLGSDPGASAWSTAGMAAADNGKPEQAEAEDPSRFGAHLEEARRWLSAEDDLGPPPADLAEILAELAVGGPAVAALRALGRLTGGPERHGVPELRTGAARIAWGFRALFNAPDATALVRGRRALAPPADPKADLPYWRAALDYAIDGNLQAVLDEYLHCLREWRGFVGRGAADLTADLAEIAHTALTLRTASYRTDVPRRANGRIRVDRHSMRGRFALRFAREQASDGDAMRIEHLSQAFNSPFWPFVLATTSVGQEGLDFHLYCHAVVHWNLPHNPVDLEQREGRVHRFKGHAVRKNVAAAYGASVLAAARSTAHDLWDTLFEQAHRQRPADASDLVPYWVFQPEHAPSGAAGTTPAARIERHVPALPLSREEGRLRALLRSVASYRLAFGQPRQEDLLRHLVHLSAREDLQSALAELRVDLSPRPE